MSTREQEKIDDQTFQADAVPTEQLDSGAAPSQANLDSEAAALDKDNIIDDESGPGGRSLRNNRGDPTAADKEIDAAIGDAEQAEV